MTQLMFACFSSQVPTARARGQAEHVGVGAQEIHGAERCVLWCARSSWTRLLLTLHEPAFWVEGDVETSGSRVQPRLRKRSDVSSFSSETKHWCILDIRSSFFRQTIPASHQLPQIMLHYGSICSVHVARLVSFESVYSVLVITHRYRLKTLLTCLYVNEYENIIGLL